MIIVGTIINYLKDETTLLFRWQTLEGAMIGPILAFIFSVLFSSTRQSRKETKENIRRIEISLTTALNDVYEIREGLREFVKNVERIILEVKAFTDDSKFFLVKTAFPPLKEVSFESEITILRSGSLYLHNKLVWISGGIRNINISINEIKEAYRVLTEGNRGFSVSNLVSHQQLRKIYIQDLESFVAYVNNFLGYLDKGVIFLVQAKVFNLKLKENGFRRTLLLYEGTSFKYFKNKKERMAYKQVFEMQSRIDKRLESDVEKLIEEAERRIRERNIDSRA